MMHREELLNAIIDAVRRQDSRALAARAAESHPSDVAEALATQKIQAVAPLLAALDADTLSRIFVYFSTETQSALLRALPRPAVIALFAVMAADERADLFNALDKTARERLLSSLDPGEREDILRLSAYPEGSVGAVTTSDYVSVRPDMSVAEALAHVRRTAADKETIYIVYVKDAEERLCGTLSLRELLLADDEQPVAAVMRRKPVLARAHWPMKTAAELIARYDLLAVPVINAVGAKHVPLR